MGNHFMSNSNAHFYTVKLSFFSTGSLKLEQISLKRIVRYHKTIEANKTLKYSKFSYIY